MLVRVKLKLRAKPSLYLPFDPVPRTAILTRGFAESSAIRVFPNGWSDWVTDYSPAVIAAPLYVLRNLSGLAPKLALTHALIALTYDLRYGIQHRDREALWRAFGVPVFEQFLDKNNKLLAYECEVHAGLHVVRGCRGLSTEMEACACGSNRPRLVRAREPARPEVELQPV